MTTIRGIERVFQMGSTHDGAGVKINKIFGYYEAPVFDPFLLLDEIHSDDPKDYTKGFPWHPHRGIETVTYMVRGDVEHGDSLGNKGSINSGDVQWMTAGSGIIHQEMPQPQEGDFWLFQLWVNLPSERKMMPPRYQDIKAESIIEHNFDGIVVKVIAGKFRDAEGPVGDLIVRTQYLDVTVPAGAQFIHQIPDGDTAFAVMMKGEGIVGDEKQGVLAKEIVLFKRKGEIKIIGGDKGVRFILISGEPIGEKVAWKGPIVMNTQEELDLAFQEYRDGTFIKT